MPPPSPETASPLPAAPPVVETRGLVRRFGEVTAVDHLDLTVREGSIFGLLGPNGAGKSTVIKMLITLLAPSEGTAGVAGFDVVRQPAEVRRRIGYVPQMLSADGGLTGDENLRLSARLYGLRRAERRRAIGEALELMGLTEVADRLVRHYSGGMIRRLEIAQALLHRPAVLFLDEPTVGLDPVARHAVLEKLRELRDQLDTTILLTTHAMDEADALCGEIAFLHQGRLAATGSPAALKAALGPQATLEDVFIHWTGAEIAPAEGYRDASRVRRTARRLG
jgi:ABC-2 type transport system ATP-binding protein